MQEILNLATFLWLLFWALFALRELSRGVRHSILFVIVVHFIFCGFPLFLDLTVGEPVYSIQLGFDLARRSELTAVIYCFYIGSCPLLWWWTGRARGGGEEEDDQDFNRRLRPLFILFLVSPLLVIFFAPEPELYLNYAARTRGLMSVESKDYYGIVVLCGKMSLLGAAGLLLASGRRFRFSSLLFLVPSIFLAAWLEGTRNVAVIAVFLLFIVLWYRGKLREVHFFAATVLIVALLAVFSYTYQFLIRPGIVEPGNFEALYRNFRIDYGRDDVIKMAIFAELYPGEMKILERRGESLLFYATMYVPRKLWPDKPWTYAVHVTSAMLGIPLGWVGWGVTTSLLDEAVANFSWAGLLLGPLLLSLICRAGDGSRNTFVRLLTILIAVLFLSVHLVVFAPIVIFWCVLVFWISLRRLKPLNPEP